MVKRKRGIPVQTETKITQKERRTGEKEKA
jgi:hypothetical protein